MKKKFKIPQNTDIIYIEDDVVYAMVPKLVKSKLGDWNIIYIRKELEELK